MKWIRKYPFAGMLALLVAGILLSFLWPESSVWLSVGGLVLSLVFLGVGLAVRRCREVMWMLAVGGFMLAFGSWHTAYDWAKSEWTDDEEAAMYQVQLLGDPVEKTASYQVDAKLLQRRDSAGVTDIRKRAMLRFDKACLSDSVMLCAGDVVLVRTKIGRPVPADRYSFDYGRFLRMEGYVGTGYVQTGGWLLADHVPLRGLMPRVRALRARIERRLEYMPLRERALVQALVLGDRCLLTEDLREAFAAAGAMHVLAVSGLHVGLLAEILLWLVTLGGRYKPLYKDKKAQIGQATVVVCVLVFYALLTGLSSSVVRSVVMFSLITVGRLLRPQKDHYNIIAASAVAILAANPLALLQSGFLLSYSAVLVIVRFAPWLERLWHPKNKVVKYFYGTVGVSLLAQLGTLPWTIGFFHRISNYFMLTNLGVLPWVEFMLIPTFLVYLSVSWIPVVSGWVGALLEWETALMNDYVGWIQGLPGATAEVSLSLLPMLLLVGLVASLLLRGRKRLVMASVMLCLFGVSLWYDYRASTTESELVVYQRAGETAVMAREGQDALLLTTDSAFAMAQTHDYRLARHVSRVTITPLDTAQQYIGLRWKEQPYALRKKKNGKYQFISTL